MSGTRSIWPVVVTAAIGIAVLCLLGAWQLQRMSWKQALLAEIAVRGRSESIGLTEVLKRRSAGEGVEFLKLSVKGHYLHETEKLVMSVFDGNPAWDVVTPLVTAEQQLILVDRGLVPDDLRDPAKRAKTNPAGDVEVAGVIRDHSTARGFFSPDNDVKANQWFWWDVPAMLAATQLPPGVTAVPFVLHVSPVAGGKSFPRPQPAAAGLHDNHLQYAMTWFALALVLLAIAGLYVRGQMKKTGA
jgi:surfeit locus 1 family protein